MGNYQPDRPYAQGMQLAPVIADAVLLDTSAELGYTFRATADVTGLDRLVLRTTQPPPGQPDRKEILANVYSAGLEAATGPIRKIVVPVTSGDLPAASLGGGAATVQAAVANPSDAGHVVLPGDLASARFWFDTSATNTRLTAALQQRRILDVSILYSLSGRFDLVPDAVYLSLERPGTWIHPVDFTLTGPAEQSQNAVPRRARLGELNPWWSSATDPDTTADRYPYVLVNGASNHIGLRAWAASGGTNICVRLETPADIPAYDFLVHYLAMEITYCQETRVAAGGLDISAGAADTDGIYEYEIPLTSMSSVGFDAELAESREYTVTVGQAHAGLMSLPSPVPVPVDVLRTGEVFPTHRGRLLRKTIRANARHEVVDSDALPSLTLYTGTPGTGTVVTDTHGYVAQAVGTAASGVSFGSLVQEIVDDAAAEYVWIRFWARASPSTTGPLNVYQVDGSDGYLGPDVRLFPAEFLELPEIANGWRQVTLRLSESVVTTGGGGTTRWLFWSAAPAGDPWQILGADANPRTVVTGDPVALTGYGEETGFARYDATDDLGADFSVFLVQEMDTVTGLAVDAAVQPLDLVDTACGIDVDCIPTGIDYHALSWDPVNSEAVAGWGYYQVQRRDTTMAAGEWETIAEITTPAVTAMDDYEARVGVESTYRVRMVHRLDIAGPWSDEVAATIPAPGVTGTRVDVGVLIMTSNADPDRNLAHVAASPSVSPEQFDWAEADQVADQFMYGRDYRVAFRPTERSGVSFTRTLLVNALGVPPATLDRGFDPLLDLAAAPLPYVCVRDELRNRWLSSLRVGQGTTQRVPDAGHLMLAQALIVEVTGTPAPWDDAAPCEGLRVQAADIMVGAGTPAPAAIATIVDLDMRMELRPDADTFLAYMESFDWSLFTGWDMTVTERYVAVDVGAFAADVPAVDMGVVKNRRAWIRVTYDSDIGGGQAQADFYRSDDGVAWTLVDSVVDTASAPAQGTPPDTELGVFVTDGITVISAQWRDSIDGTEIASPDFGAQAAGTDEFDDDQSNTWTTGVEGGICGLD